ncbi:MAG: tRNA (adenine-N1)-methyltransferase [bacterium]|nr:tRNA (adenine-N1)-methyltransferase [bacterium]MCY4257434.1 tRNA (adenine-N1)-methyltransferase [bacterium]
MSQAFQAGDQAFQAGDLVLLSDRKGRQYLVRLVPGKLFHTHAGSVSHDSLIGANEGTQMRTTRNAELTVWRPTLQDYALKMRRGAQVIYPKDSAAILMLADIYPGAKVLESGVGSGGLSLCLLRAGAEVVGYEIREDFAAQARQNVTDFMGTQAEQHYEVQVRDCYEGIQADCLDRIILDLAEPWHVVPHAVSALRSGGMLAAYTPSIMQAKHLREACSSKTWGQAQTTEILHRNWHIDKEAVRPEHRMIGHTGFITTVRRLSADA